jgi:ATP-dependent Clp protease ATP-binding subunit ClpA
VGRLIEDRIKSFFVDEVLFGRLEEGGHATADYADGEYIIEIADPAPKEDETELLTEAAK